MSPSSLLSPASLLSHTGLLQTFTCLKKIFSCDSNLELLFRRWLDQRPRLQSSTGSSNTCTAERYHMQIQIQIQKHALQKVSDITYRITHPSLESVHPSICVFCESVCISLTMSYLFLYESIVCVFVFLHFRCICVFVFYVS